MSIALAEAGYDVQFVIVHGASASSASAQDAMTNKVEFPVFQDTNAVNAWELHGGAKDDIYIYRADGTLSVWLDYSGALSIAMSTEAGYSNVWDAIVAATEE